MSCRALNAGKMIEEQDHLKKQFSLSVSPRSKR